MRGDSLRDLYAKTFALLGLALVGALGAVVDYWPATQPLPRVSEPLPAPALAGLSARANAVLDSPIVLANEIPAPSHTPAVRRKVQPVSMAVRIASASDVVGIVSPIAFEAPAPPVTSIAIEPVTALPTAEVALIAPELAPEPPAATFTQHGAGHGPADQGFLTDATEAAKRAGSTIMSGTMKTGASIVDGLRSVGGAVRRGLGRFVP